MRKSRFTHAVKLSIVQQKRDGISVRRLSCQYDVSHATIYQWDKRYPQQENPKFEDMRLGPSIRSTEQPTRSDPSSNPPPPPA